MAHSVAAPQQGERSSLGIDGNMVTIKDDKCFGFCIDRFVVCRIGDRVVTKDQPVDGISVEKAGIETMKSIVLDEDIPVISDRTDCGLFHACTDLYGGIAPGPIIAIIKDVAPDGHIADPGLLEPIASITFKQQRGSGRVKNIVFDHDFASRTN